MRLYFARNEFDVDVKMNYFALKVLLLLLWTALRVRGKVRPQCGPLTIGPPGSY
jgi:hypothetical protein